MTIIDEIRHFIDDVVASLVTTYTAVSPWNLTELLEHLEQITGAGFVESDYTQISSANELEERLTEQLHEMYDLKFADLEQAQAMAYLRRIYLTVIDRHRMDHIDDMQYLRDKVSLYGYAQLDPLVIYKKEAYDKFQKLLFTLKRATVAQVMRTEFSQIKSAEEVAQQLQQQRRSVNMVDILKAVTKGLKAQPVEQVAQQQAAEQVTVDGDKQANVIESDDDVEVLEVQDDSAEQPDAEGVVHHVDHKLRPNDRITIRYAADGRVERDVKYKKVKKAIEAGEAEVVSS